MVMYFKWLIGCLISSAMAPMDSMFLVVSRLACFRTDQAAVGVWLERMDDLGIFEDIWLVQSTTAVLGESQEAAVTFLAQARLTSEARGPRAVDPTTWVMPADLSEEPS